MMVHQVHQVLTGPHAFDPQEMQHTTCTKQQSIAARCLPAQAQKAAATAAEHGKTGYQAGLVAMLACPLTAGSQPAALR